MYPQTPAIDVFKPKDSKRSSLEEHERNNEWHDPYVLPTFVRDKQEEVYKRHRFDPENEEKDKEMLEDLMGPGGFELRYQEYLRGGLEHKVVMNILKRQNGLPLDERYPLPTWAWY